jgi:hypothetical protein
MLGFLSRVLIVLIVFTAGALVGNIYMPQKQLEQGLVTSISEPKTTLNLNKEPGTQEALKALEQTDKALYSAGMEEGAVFPISDTIRSALVLQAYKTAKCQYEVALLKAQSNPGQRGEFLKIQDNYFKIKTLLETYYPLQKLEVEILEAAAAAPQAAAQPAGPDNRTQNGADAGKTNK